MNAELINVETFLNRLIDLARRYGHDGDYIEIRKFVKWCFEENGREPPTDEMLEPYPVVEE